MPNRMPADRENLVDTTQYITVPEIARDTGQTVTKIHYWLRYQQLMQWTRIFNRTVVHRDEYARFKREHPELIKTAEAATQ